MTAPIVIASVVEGEGEVVALPVLLRRVASEIAPGAHVDIPKPIRVTRSKIVRPGELERYVELAVRLSRATGVLVLLDTDDDCPVELGATLLRRARAARPDRRLSVVLAVREFEAWFLAAADSIAGQRGLPNDLVPPDDPEAVRDAKGWLRARRTDGLGYGPTVDQPALAATFDLASARERSPSFAKLWRDVARLLEPDRPERA